MGIIPKIMSHARGYRLLAISAAQPWSVQVEDPLSVT